MAARVNSVQIPRLAVTSPFMQAAGSAALYTVLCTAYIYLSGNIAAKMAQTPEQLHTIETIKGVAFILLTGLLFFIISYLRWSRIRQQEERLFKEETTLVQAEKKLVAAMSAAMVAHDLNNLLMSLSGLIEKIKSREQADPSVAAMSQQIDVAIAKLSHLVRRLESGAGHAVLEKKENIDLQRAVHEMVSVVQAHPDVRSCRISASDVAPLTLKLNRSLLEETVLNLLINAAQATGPNGQIEVKLTTEPGSALLAVHDNGPGVPDFLVKDIFEPCFSTKPGGTGIGLLAVNAFSSSCGGVLTVSRSPLGGALFQIRIPVPHHPRKPLAAT
jgi:signal transduction histidine kinase